LAQVAASSAADWLRTETESAPQKLDIAHTRATASPSPHPALAQRQRKHPMLAGLVGQPTHAIADW
jgi:hypothetical protein